MSEGDTVQDAPPAETTPPPPASDPAATAETNDQAGDDDDESHITERYRVPQDLYDNLTSMGFSANAVKKSIIAGCIDENTCMQWLEMHLDHPELNTDIEPHIKVSIVKKRVLTDEERAAKVMELKRRIQENKALEAQRLKEAAITDEKRRIEEGKAAAAAKAAREAAQRKADYEQRRKEKEQDRVLKEKLQFELTVDRFIRTGLSREDAVVRAKQEYEEKAAKLAEERARREEADRAEREARERDEAAKRASAGESKPSSGGWDLSKFILPSEAELAEQGGATAAPSSSSVVVDFDRDEPLIVTGSGALPTEADFAAVLAKSFVRLPKDDARSVTGRQILHRILKAIELGPLDRKVRTIKVTSTVFTQKLMPMPLACLFLRQAGFQEASSTPELGAAGVSDLFTMHVCILSRVRAAIAALEASGGF